MEPAPARNTIRVNGRIGATVPSAFPVMTAWRQGAQTVLAGLMDKAVLDGVLADIEASPGWVTTQHD